VCLCRCTFQQKCTLCTVGARIIRGSYAGRVVVLYCTVGARIIRGSYAGRVVECSALGCALPRFSPCIRGASLKILHSNTPSRDSVTKFSALVFRQTAPPDLNRYAYKRFLYFFQIFTEILDCFGATLVKPSFIVVNNTDEICELYLFAITVEGGPRK
jgi:hypothetical protein